MVAFFLLLHFCDSMGESKLIIIVGDMLELQTLRCEI